MRKVWIKPLACFLAILLLLPAMPTALAVSDNAFTDVSSSAWYYGEIQHMAQEGLMEGIGGGSFAPDAPLTRAMFVTILGRIEYINADYYAKATSFKDVQAGSWYAPYVAWAAKNGITNGISATEFAPDVNITREQMATLIARYVNKFGVSLGKTDHPAEKFRDTDAIADYATSAVELMRQTGIIIGDGENFLPRNNATRAQAAAVFSRLIFATPVDYGTPVEGVDYKITYAASKACNVVPGMNPGSIWLWTIGVIENTGDRTLAIEETLADVDGISRQETSSKGHCFSCPSVIAPGEKSYLFDTPSTDMMEEKPYLNVKFKIDARYTREESVWYNTMDVSISPDETFDLIRATGKVTNHTEKTISFALVTVVLFDDNDNPVWIIHTGTDEIPSKGTVEFEGDLMAPLGTTLDNISRYESFASSY